jgi:hypothetical protein
MPPPALFQVHRAGSRAHRFRLAVAASIAWEAALHQPALARDHIEMNVAATASLPAPACQRLRHAPRLQAVQAVCQARTLLGRKQKALASVPLASLLHHPSLIHKP